MAEINLLDSSTIDKIAAGEVVERPASVVKELVENAIDAGADSITVEIKEGGISFIRVTDNGSGIEKEQVKKAFLRHATSKIKTVEDLLGVSSLGFRGEALSSIAAVAQVELITKTADALTGIRCCIDGGVEKEFEEIGAPNGTTFLIRNLFFNTPPRRKFLKTAATEGGYICDLMEHMAMSKPHVAFQYIQNGQTRFHTSGNGELKEIIYRIYGRATAAELIWIESSCEGVKLSGYLGRPVLNRANRNFENYFVNHRYIKSEVISKAIEEGYRNYLMQHKYPFTVLHFTFDPDLLDVNVHPAKMEVRFLNQMHFYEFVVRSVEQGMQEKELIPEITLTPPEPAQDIVMTKQKAPEPFETQRSELYKVAEESQYHVEMAENSDITAKMQDNLQNTALGRVIGSLGSRETSQNDKVHASVIKQKDHIFVEKPEQMNFFSDKILSREASASYHILGQLFDTYWLIAYEDKLLMIDQHAAHEKVKYERLVKQLREKEILSQNLNPPVIVTLSGAEESALKEYQEQFQALGFEIESFGGNEYAIRSVPVDLYGCKEDEMLLAVLEDLSGHSVKGAPEIVYEKLASMACKAAVKGNSSMSRPEIEALIQELLELENPYHCPHGRPTMISMSQHEIERKFKRII